MAVDLRKAHTEGLNAAVAAELRAEKAAQNLTNQDITDRSEIPVVSVQRYLAPKRAIDVMVLEKLAAAVGKTASEIVAAAEIRLEKTYGAADLNRVVHKHGTGDAMPRLHALARAAEATDDRIAVTLGLKPSAVAGWWQQGMKQPLSDDHLHQLAWVCRVSVGELREAMLIDMGWLDEDGAGPRPPHRAPTDFQFDPAAVEHSDADTAG